VSNRDCGKAPQVILYGFASSKKQKGKEFSMKKIFIYSYSFGDGAKSSSPLSLAHQQLCASILRDISNHFEEAGCCFRNFDWRVDISDRAANSTHPHFLLSFGTRPDAVGFVGQGSHIFHAEDVSCYQEHTFGYEVSYNLRVETTPKILSNIGVNSVALHIITAEADVSHREQTMTEAHAQSIAAVFRQKLFPAAMEGVGMYRGFFPGDVTLDELTR